MSPNNLLQQSLIFNNSGPDISCHGCSIILDKYIRYAAVRQEEGLHTDTFYNYCFLLYENDITGLRTCLKIAIAIEENRHATHAGTKIENVSPQMLPLKSIIQDSYCERKKER